MRGVDVGVLVVAREVVGLTGLPLVAAASVTAGLRPNEVLSILLHELASVFHAGSGTGTPARWRIDRGP